MNDDIILEEIPLGEPRLKDFVDLPWKLHRGDACWTPPLRADYLGNKLLGSVGLLTPEHPYHEHAKVTHFLARRNGQAVGRISAAINYRFNEYHDTNIGFFGFFESIEDFEVARVLLDAARSWVEKQGMSILRGPGEYSNATHERQGILVEGFEYPPTVELTHNPPYYAAFLARYGLEKAKDYHAYRIFAQDYQGERIARIAPRLKKRRGITTRSADLDNLQEEVRLIIDIYNDAWSQNWGFLPITQEEADMLAETLRPVLVPDLVRFAYINGESAAVFTAIPDLYVALRPRWQWPLDTEPVRIVRAFLMAKRIHRLRVFFFGVRPQFRRLGLDAILFHEAQQYALPHGYNMFEPSLLLENNELILNVSQNLGGEQYKTWRIYEMPL
jgi:GNAT superfamily N-acetyltransferase